MVKVYSLELPDKRVIDIEAPDEQSAMQAAGEWYKANPYKVTAQSAPKQDPRIDALMAPSAAQRMLSMVPGLGGALDEIGAAGDAAFHYLTGGRTGEKYDDALKRRRDLIKKDDENAGVQNYVDKGLGIALTATSTPFMRVFGRTGGTVANTADAALNAGIYGALEGFTGGEGGFQNRLQNAGTTGTTSAAFGGAFGFAGDRLASRLTSTAGTVVDDAANIGVQVPRFMGDSRAEQALSAKLGAIPFVGDDINAAVARTREQAGQAARNIADGITGGRVTPQNAGDTARGAMRTWADDTARIIQDRAYAPLNQTMAGTVSPLSNTRRVTQQLQALTTQAADRPIYGQAIDEALPAIQNMVPGRGNSAPQQGMTWEGLSALRTRVGAMIDNAIDPQARVNRAGLQQLYSALSQDMEAVIRAQGGPRAVDQWRRANRITQQIAQRRDTIARIIGTEGDRAGENIVDRLVTMASTKSTADAARLAQARRVMPADAWNELSSAAIERLGRNQSNEFSADIFLKNWTQLSNEGRRLLFGSTGQGRVMQDLNRLAAVSQRLQQFNRLGNPSGTGGVAAVLTAITGMGMGDAGATAGSMVAARGLGYLLSRPAVVRQATQTMQAYERFLRNPQTRAAFSNAAMQLARAVSQETGEDEQAVAARITAATGN